MITFLKGKVETITSNLIEVDVNGIGYGVFVSNSELYKLNEQIKIFTYNHIRENEISLYGFETTKIRHLFLILIGVKGIGVKTALAILSKTTPSQLVNAIKTSDINYLNKLPSVGLKTAQQMILDLKRRLNSLILDNGVNNLSIYDEAKQVLKGFDFKNQEIDLALENVLEPNIDLENCILKALQFLNKK